MNSRSFFSTIEKFKAPSTILFRSIELKLLKEKLSKISKSDVILDLGCGEGLTASLVFDKKVDYGLDNDPYFVKKAKESNVYKKVLLANAVKMPLKDNCLDLVFSNCVIEHIQDLDAVLREAARILKKKGYFVFTTPSNNFKKYSLFSRLKLNWLAKIYGRARDGKLNHCNCCSIKKWTQILKKRGFKVIDGYYYIDKETAEFWDFLFILNKLFYLLKLMSQKLFRWFYETFLKQRIYKKFIEFQAVDSNGSAVCLVAQKI